MGTKDQQTKPSPRSRWKRPLAFLLAFAVVGALVVVLAPASVDPYDREAQAKLKNEPSKGLIYTDLKKIKKNANHPCRGSFEVQGVTHEGQPICTHGPDKSSRDVDLTKVDKEQRVKEIDQLPKNEISEDKLRDTSPEEMVTAAGGLLDGQNTFPLSSPACGTDGRPVQLMIVMSGPVSQAYVDLVARVMRDTARRVETQVEISSLFSGPNSSLRKIRFLTDPNCVPNVKTMKFWSASTPITFSKVIERLSLAGYNKNHMKYLIWNLTPEAGFCGQACFFSDSNPNWNNRDAINTGYGVVGPGCFNTKSELHELAHTLGGVSLDAPHTTGGFHCWDRYDILCYDDGPRDGFAANGKAIEYPCGSVSYEWYLDCEDNDYFNTSRSIHPTNYLYNHWNTANSGWFQKY